MKHGFFDINTWIFWHDSGTPPWVQKTGFPHISRGGSPGFKNPHKTHMIYTGFVRVFESGRDCRVLFWKIDLRMPISAGFSILSSWDFRTPTLRSQLQKLKNPGEIGILRSIFENNTRQSPFFPPVAQDWKMGFFNFLNPRPQKIEKLAIFGNFWDPPIQLGPKTP